MRDIEKFFYEKRLFLFRAIALTFHIS